MRRILIPILLLAVAAAAFGYWWYNKREQRSDELVLFGNIDLRHVQLAFNNSERIAKVHVEEGHRVSKGEPIAELDIGRLQPQVAQAKAQVAAQREVVARLQAGSRPEEKAQARANVASANADLVNARLQYDRAKKLSVVQLPDKSQAQAISKEDLDKTKAAFDVADAKLTMAQKSLDLTLKGPRVEEIAEAEARLRASEAQLALLVQMLNDAQLFAPADAVVRSRLMQPGEMATPMKPVVSLAVINPKWVRAYVTETKLGFVRENMKAKIRVDSFPDREFDGWVGFISPIAEFTPKTVQTEDLRTSLVFEVRVFVTDPGNELRLGMPATVHLPLPDSAK